MTDLKKIIFASLALFLVLSVSDLSTTFARTLPSSENMQIDFEQLIQKIISGIDKTIVKLNSIENKITSNPDVSEETKTSISSSFAKMEKILLDYKSKIEVTTTLEELQTVNQEIMNYLIENKDVFKENIKRAITDIAEQAAERADEFKAVVEKMLAALKITCPSERETIAALEAELQQLESKIVVLQQAIASQDTQTMKQEIAKLSDDINQIVALVRKLEEACF